MSSSDSESSKPCCCNDTTKQRTHLCYNCEAKWNEPMGYSERISSCPQHHFSIAICGGSPSLCTKCQADGYIVSGGWGMAGTLELTKNGVKVEPVVPLN